MKKFCPNCGRETEKLYNSLCIHCCTEKFRGKKYIKKRNISFCNCGAVGLNNKWEKNISFDDFIVSIIKKELKTIYKKCNEYNFSFFKKKKEDNVTVHINVEKNKIKITEYAYYFTIKNRMCSLCSSEKKGYYEAVLQLRARKKTLDEFIDVVNNIVNSYNGRNSFAKIIGKKSNAIDMHLGTKKILSKIKKKISEKYNIDTKTSFSLYKIKNGKEIYRTTLLIREKYFF